MPKSKPKATRLMGLLIGLLWIEAQLPCIAQFSPTNAWVLELPDFHSSSSPAIAPDGTIYQATWTGKLLAVTPQGTVKWIFKAGREVKSSPAVGDDGTIYFGSRDWKF